MQEKKVAKKKVSFDIDVKDLDNIRAFCTQNNKKLSDFLREAAVKKFNEENQNLIVFYFNENENKVKRLVVNRDIYNIETIDLDRESKVNLNIENLVRITKKSKDYDNSELDILLSKNNDSLKCFSK